MGPAFSTNKGSPGKIQVRCIRLQTRLRQRDFLAASETLLLMPSLSDRGHHEPLQYVTVFTNGSTELPAASRCSPKGRRGQLIRLDRTYPVREIGRASCRERV